MKRVLVVYYSQTGQLQRLAASVCAPLAGAGVELDECELRPDRPYPFPWPFWRFFDQFPETVHLDAPALQPLGIAAGRRYDLIVLAYTVWYLSPAPPVTAFVTSAQGRALLRDTPVVTLIGCRNMWMLAQQTMRALLDAAGARFVDHIALTDPGPSLATFVTTPRWMLSGRREAFWGVFPRAGLSEAQIADAARFGHALRQALLEDRLLAEPSPLAGLNAAVPDLRLLPSEKIGRRSFQIWGAMIRALGPQGAWQRRPLLAIYALFLVLMIVTVVPVTMLLRALWGRLRKNSSTPAVTAGSRSF